MDDFLTRDEVSDLLKIPKSTLDYLVATGQIPFSRIGKRAVRFHRSTVVEWAVTERNGVEYRLSRKASTV